jgi:hypothetical protein
VVFSERRHLRWAANRDDTPGCVIGWMSEGTRAQSAIVELVTAEGTVALTDRVRLVACPRDSSSTSCVPSFAGFRFPPDVVLLAVRWYLRYGLSYRDVEELLAERGVEVDHVTIYRWVQRFTPLVVAAVSAQCG